MAEKTLSPLAEEVKRAKAAQARRRAAPKADVHSLGTQIERKQLIKRFFPDKKVKIIRKRNRFFYLWLHLSRNKLILSHFPWIILRLPIRILKLDFVYTVALFKAVMLW